MSYIQNISGDIDLIDALPRGVTRGQADVTTGAFASATGSVGQYGSILSIRGKTGLGEIRLYEIIPAIACTTNNILGEKWALLLDPTITNNSPTWVDVPGSKLQSCISRTNTSVVTGGIVLASGQYGVSASVSTSYKGTTMLTGIGAFGKIIMTEANGTTQHEVVLASTSGTTSNYITGALSWKEKA